MTDKPREIDVLIIDDEPTVATALSRMLRLEGLTVETAQSADDGLRRVKESGCRVLICDQNMPEMMGTRLLATADENGFRGKKILMTGLERTPEVEYAARSGMEVFHKPWDTEELKSRVQRALKESSANP